MHFSKLSAFLLPLAATLCLTACKKDKDVAPTGTVALRFDHKVGNAALDLTQSKAAYRTASGDSFRVTKFLYYVSNVRFNRAGGESFQVPESYFLVDEARATSKNVAMAGIPAADYTSLTFTVGVDSARNVAGAQTGALDPSNAMFWSWNTGYIFLKLEGNFVQPGTRTEGALVLHVGGFRRPTNAIRTLTLPLPGGVPLAVGNGRTPEIHVVADVLRMLDGTTASGTTPISFTARPGSTRLSNVMTAGGDAVKVADNYARPAGGMFRIDRVGGN